MGIVTPECVGVTYTLGNPSKMQFWLSIPAEGAWDLFKFPSERGAVAPAGYLESKASYSPLGHKKVRGKALILKVWMESQKKMMIVQTTGNVLHSSKVLV